MGKSEGNTINNFSKSVGESLTNASKMIGKTIGKGILSILNFGNNTTK